MCAYNIIKLQISRRIQFHEVCSRKNDVYAYLRVSHSWLKTSYLLSGFISKKPMYRTHPPYCKAVRTTKRKRQHFYYYFMTLLFLQLKRRNSMTIRRMLLIGLIKYLIYLSNKNFVKLDTKMCSIDVHL